jgi:hypothetical protein
LYKSKSIEELAARIPHGANLRFQKRRCGKAACRRCPHGPYWYAAAKIRGRMVSFYIGSPDRKAALLAEWKRTAQPELFDAKQKDCAAGGLPTPAAAQVDERAHNLVDP